jgi:predicted Zn-dependent protease
VIDIKLKIAKAYYYMSEFYQAESEAKNTLQRAEKGPKRFELELFLANIYFNTKRMDKAVEAYKKLDEDYPELAKKEKVKMSLVVCYEETEKFKDAISLLENMKLSSDEDPEFLDLKIARLKERIRNLPGSRGLRK